ncbi:MAG: class I SAM-dependent methyltransferase family protein [Euryarchaeota archaeon]|nr:class I SAM-dependent methyltransferase family protein [Euryarchaeota archaeon]
MRSRCAVVPRGEGERARKYLSERGILRKDLRISRDGDSILIPVAARGKVPYATRTAEFAPSEKRPTSYKEHVDLPRKLHPLLPSAFDIVGDVAIIKLPDELTGHASAIGKAIIGAQKSIKSVALDEGVEGEARIRKLLVIAGRKTMLTVHKENGLRLKVDPSVVYFSPRLASERARVAGQVGEGENVIDMFAGVGPFSLLVARRVKSSRIDAIDINTKAIKLLKENIELNKTANVRAHIGDASKIVPRLKGADRVIMNLPHSAHEFLKCALRVCRKGATIHLYQHITRDETDGRWGEIASKCMEAGAKVRLQRYVIVHPYSPSSGIVCYDIKIVGFTRARG